VESTKSNWNCKKFESAKVSLKKRSRKEDACLHAARPIKQKTDLHIVIFSPVCIIVRYPIKIRKGRARDIDNDGVKIYNYDDVKFLS